MGRSERDGSTARSDEEGTVAAASNASGQAQGGESVVPAPPNRRPPDLQLLKSPGALEKGAVETASPELEDPVRVREELQVVMSRMHDEGFDAAKELLSSQFLSLIRHELATHGLLDQYHFLFLSNERESIDSTWMERLRKVIEKPDFFSKPVLFYIRSPGGDPDEAYLLARNIQALAGEQKVVAVIPQSAKSAATLMAIACDEIHMGLRSQLGPIDPQRFNKTHESSDPDFVSSLSTVEGINQLSGALDVRTEGVSRVFSDFLAKVINIEKIGEFSRAAFALEQYAYRLLCRRHSAEVADKVSTVLVRHFKMHGFVIDEQEAEDLFNLGGKSVVKFRTPEVAAAERIADLFDACAKSLRYDRKLNGHTAVDIHLCGGLESPPYFNPVRDSED